MTISRQDVLDEIIQLLQRLSADWEYSGTIGESTFLLDDLGLQSLDVVILANTVQEHYGRAFPFTEFFAAIGERGGRDVSVGEWADFIYEQLTSAAEERLVGGARA